MDWSDGTTSVMVAAQGAVPRLADGDLAAGD